MMGIQWIFGPPAIMLFEPLERPSGSMLATCLGLARKFCPIGNCIGSHEDVCFRNPVIQVKLVCR